MNPIIEQSGNRVRLTYSKRTVVAAELDDAGLLVVTYSDGVVDHTGINIFVSPVPTLALTYSDGTPLTYSDGVYLEYSA